MSVFEVFSKKLYLMVLWGTRITKYYAIRIEFQERGSHHVHSITWIFNVANIQNEAGYIEFIEQTITTQLPDHLNAPELFELVKTYQDHTHSITSWKYNRNECRFYYGRYFTEKTIIAKSFDAKFSNEEKQEILTCRNTLLSQAKAILIIIFILQK